METTAEKVARLRAQLKQAAELVKEEPIPIVGVSLEDDVANIDYPNGAMYDEDNGESLGIIDLKDAHKGQEVDTLPAKISIFLNGYFYVFSITGRYRSEESEEENAQKTM